MSDDQLDAYCISKSIRKQVPIFGVIREINRGKSILRAMQNFMIDDVKLKGSTVDLGARNQQANYYRFIDTTEAEIVYCDIDSNCPGVVEVDLEKPLPFEDGQFDNVLLMHVLEHIYDTDGLLRQIRRVCRGQALIVVPFAAPYHADPNDYYRFSHQCLKRKLTEAGFDIVHVFSFGKGPFVHALYIVQRFIYFRFLISALFVIAWGLDSALTRIFPDKIKHFGDLGYICIGECEPAMRSTPVDLEGAAACREND